MEKVNTDLNDPKAVVEAIVRFMTNTNMIIADMKIQLNNQQIDIDKLKRELKKPRNRLLELR